MSFGFSIGDIILVSQLSYKLYTTFTSGRRNADRDLEELDQLLFGLHCALNHLRHVAKEVSETPTATSVVDATTREMWQKLNQMVQNCGTTLEDLDSVTKRYREGAKQEDAEEDVDNNSSHKKRRRVKRILESNLTKVRWDMDKETMKAYRDKLQSHLDGLNLVLNTFHWSNAQRLHADGRADAEKMEQFQEKVVASNSALESLVKDIHSMLAVSNNTSRPPNIAQSPQRPKNHSKRVCELGAPHDRVSRPAPMLAAMNLNMIGVDSVAAHFVDVPMTERAFEEPGNLINTFPSPKNPTIQPDESVVAPYSQLKVNTIPNNLPPTIVSLNAKRQMSGAKMLAVHEKKLAPIPRPSFMTPKVLTVRELEQGLKYVFSPLLSRTLRQLQLERETRATEIGTWTQALDHLLEKQVQELSISAAEGAMLLGAEQQSDLIGLLSNLNEAIEKTDANSRALFYESSHAAQIDRVLNKLLVLTHSVRASKEVEEFMDERAYWKQEH